MIDGVDDTRGSVVAGGRGYYLKVLFGLWRLLNIALYYIIVLFHFSGSLGSWIVCCLHVHKKIKFRPCSRGEAIEWKCIHKIYLSYRFKFLHFRCHTLYQNKWIVLLNNKGLVGYWAAKQVTIVWHCYFFTARVQPCSWSKHWSTWPWVGSTRRGSRHCTRRSSCARRSCRRSRSSHSLTRNSTRWELTFRQSHGCKFSGRSSGFFATKNTIFYYKKICIEKLVKNQFSGFSKFSTSPMQSFCQTI